MKKIYGILCVIVIWLLVLSIFTINYVFIYDRKMQSLDLKQDEANINTHEAMIEVINDNTNRISNIEMNEVEK